MTAPGPGGRRPIRPLDEATISQIAAGEVVERPASVVKELVENAFDAEATEVVVRIEEGGLSLIEVADDGFGIPPEQLALAVERHSTSKILRATDLETVGTLGFRGEALAAIGAVSHLRILSRTADAQEARGLSVMGGVVVGPFLSGRPLGTTVEVRELFFNTPARRKFLRSPAAEQVEVAGVLERLYLAHPAVGLTLIAEGQEVERLPASRDLANAAARVLGEEFPEQAIPIDSAGPQGLRLDGLVARPALSRPTTQGLYLSVNGRVIESRALAQAVRAAYADYLPRGRFPVGVLHLGTGPGRLDVNVHPTKREVRFLHEREVAETVRRAVREALLASPQWRDSPLSLPGPEPMEPPRIIHTEGADARLSPRERPGSGDGSVRPATLQQVLLPAGEGRRVDGDRRHPALAILGSIMALYWLAESGDALVLIDQHAASERVVFEALRPRERLPRQVLMEPALLSLSARLRGVLEEHTELLDRAGFEVEPFGPGTYRLRAVPTFLGHRASPAALPPLLEELAAGGRPTATPGPGDRVAASVACHAAVRGGDRIESEELARILRSLYDLPEASYACPHGRPIMVRVSRSQLDRWFLRRGA